jgi:hypothetical protein
MRLGTAIGYASVKWQQPVLTGPIVSEVDWPQVAQSV